MELTMQDKSKLIEFFEFQRDKEASKPLGEMDTEAIDAYVKVLLHLQDKHIEISSDFIDKQVRNIFHPEDIAASETATLKKRYNKRIIWIVAACIALLVALFSMVSVASDDWSFIEFIKEKFGSVQSAPIGEEIEFNGEIIYVGEKSTVYSTIDEALKSEKVNILYPSVLPDDIKITEVVFEQTDGVKNASYVFNDISLSSNIIFDTEISEAEKDVAIEVKEINSLICYICEMEDVSTTQITFEYEGNTYTFSYSEKEVLIEIIENLKEIDDNG